jgi:hypothetical protein
MNLAIITTHFNPGQYKAPQRNLLRFLRQLGAEQYPVFVGELCYDEDRPLLPPSPHLLQLRTTRTQAMWHKENLVNLVERKVPPEFDAIAWIDGDVWFQRLDWYEATCAALETHAVVQLFSEHVFTGEDGRECGKATGAAAAGRIQDHHPGLAWAARRSLWSEAGGLYEGGILGAGDVINGTAWLPGVEVGWMRDAKLEGQLAKLRQWTTAHGGCGHVEGTLWHEWHGSGRDRQYDTRYQNLHLLNRERDLRHRSDGLLEWTEAVDPVFRAGVQAFFKQRREDGSG